MGAVLAASGRGWVDLRAQSKGAALAFYTLFSMAPMLILALGIAGHVLGTHAARGELFSQLRGLLSPHLAAAVQSLVLDAHVPGSGGGLATVVAFVLLAVGATSVFAELKDSLDDIWQKQAPIPMGLLAILRSRVVAFALVLILTVLFLVSLLLNAFLALVNALWTGPLPPGAILSPLFAFGILTALFAVIFKMLPQAHISWRDALAGALFTAVLFSLGRRVIGVYLGSVALTSSFGAAGSFAALLIWVYYSAQIFFLGAVFTREYALAFGSLQETAPGLGQA
jgi:membrane protein